MSTKLFFQNSESTRVVREWRIVSIPDGNEGIDVIGLYMGICSHSFDPMEPYVPVEGDRPIRVQVGKEQMGKDYQDLSSWLMPLNYLVFI